MSRVFFAKGNGFQAHNKSKANKLYLHLNPDAKSITVDRKNRIKHDDLIINVAASASTSAMLTSAVQDETKKLLKNKILPPNSGLSGIDRYVMVRQIDDERIAIYTVNKSEFPKLTSFLGEDKAPLSNVSWNNLSKAASIKTLVLKISELDDVFFD